ncbi:RDD family protein [uncultured Flavobacterium sp.]|uniref:RDD family protein n=1 Tax=uncultured Flavobacterium sp. TaxID=165435 RepID=UPI0025D04C80|nr:RDD family protein [uncultured Flavobacterium sp.]
MNNTNSREFELDDDLFASHGQRFANYLIDYICQILIMFGVFMIIVMISISNGDKTIIAKVESLNQVVKYAFASVIVLVYYNVFEIFFSVTIGKLITDTIVVDRNGYKPQTNEILVRSLCRLIPFEILSFLGVPGKGWHDSISKTYVVKRRLFEERKRVFNAQNKSNSIEE